MKVPILTYVPGKGATEFFSAFSGNRETDHFYHEEIAYTVAHGASLAGSTALVFVKSHGIAKAMNSVIASLHAGVAAPLVVFTFEDEQGSSSDHPFSSRRMLEGAGAKVSPATKESLPSVFAEAISFSEANKLPAFLSIGTRDLPDPASIKAFAHEALNHIHRLPEFTPLPRYQALLNPLLSSRYTSPLPEIPHCPRDLPPHLASTARSYEPVIKVLKNIGYSWVTGDAGTSSLFGLPPHDFVDVCTHMGGAIPLAMGSVIAGKNRVLAVTGDFSLISTGTLALSEARQRGLSFDVLIFQNGIAAATGGQIVPNEMLMAQLPGDLEVHQIAGDLKLLSELLQTPRIHDSPRVVIFETQN
jgi:TPP-dependent indolepyruvate ferredoxin oxidoreductase alpha subunit